MQEAGQAKAPAATPWRLPEGTGFSRRDILSLLCRRPGRPSLMPVRTCRPTLYQAGRRPECSARKWDRQGSRPGVQGPACFLLWMLEPSLRNHHEGSQRLPNSPTRFRQSRLHRNH